MISRCPRFLAKQLEPSLIKHIQTFGSMKSIFEGNELLVADKIVYSIVFAVLVDKKPYSRIGV